MITPIYASILALLFIALSIITIRQRRNAKIAVGTGENKQLLRATRAHGNFTEYAPFALLLAFMLETNTGDTILLHFICASLLVGRILHSYGVSKLKENFRFRVIGMALTFTSIASSAISLLYLSLF